MAGGVQYQQISSGWVNGNIGGILQPVGEGGEKATLGIELLHSSHFAIGYVNIAALIHSQPHRFNKIATAFAFAAPGAQEPPLVVKHLNPVHFGVNGVNGSVRAHSNSTQERQNRLPLPFLAPLAEENTVDVEFLDSML